MKQVGKLILDFEEVPSGALKRHIWSPMFWGGWLYKENIGILEARMVLKSLKRICLTRYGHDIRQLHLRDNLGVVLSIDRFRSKNYKLLKIIRCIAAYCFGRNISFSIRWMPSELNISDEPSRIHDPSDSKLLVDLIGSPDFECFFPQGAPTSKQQQNTAVAAAGQCAEVEQDWRKRHLTLKVGEKASARGQPKRARELEAKGCWRKG